MSGVHSGEESDEDFSSFLATHKRVLGAPGVHPLADDPPLIGEERRLQDEKPGFPGVPCKLRTDSLAFHAFYFWEGGVAFKHL